MTEVEPKVVPRLDQLDPADAAILAAVWRRCADAAPHVGPPIWLHGDLHPLNVVIGFDAKPTLRAVIDWGQLAPGGPGGLDGRGHLVAVDPGPASRSRLGRGVELRARAYAKARAAAGRNSTL